MNEIPKISITQDFVTDDHEDDNLDDIDECGDIYEAHTDIENLDSDDDKGLSNIKMLKARKKAKSKKIENCHTDVESCQDSGSDDGHSDRSKTFDNKMNLNEFLDQGYTDETSSFGGENEIKQSQRGKRASLLVPEEDDGAITDCENLDDTSDEESKTASIVVCNAIDEQKFNNFLLHNDDYSTGNVNNSSSLKTRPKRGGRIISGKNIEISDSECDLMPNSWNELSDMEGVVLSDQEFKQSRPENFKSSANALDFEEMIVAVCDVEDSCPNTPKTTNPPELLVAFICNRPKKLRISARARSSKVAQSRNMLTVLQCADDAEAITDFEVLDSSDDERENIQKELTIPIAYVSSSPQPLTDVECFDVDDSDLAIPSTSRDIKLPSPVREICVMREDEHGDPVAKVMPLVGPDNGQFLNISDNYVDKGLTDTEQMSGDEEDSGNGNEYDLAEMPDIDSGTVTSSESLVLFVCEKRADYEPLTDIEDLQMVNNKQSRRKKIKPKANKTPDGLLAVNNEEQDVLTENDEVLMEEDQAAGYFSRHIQIVASATIERSNENDNTLTDTESISGDEETLFGKALKEIDPNMLRQETFFSTITLTDSSSSNKYRGQYPDYSKISTIVKTREAHDSSAEMSVTSVEELAHSDTDDMLGIDLDSHNQSVTPNELRTVFNESHSSCIHDQSRSQYDRTNEMLQMKNFVDIQDTHTDVECLEDDKSKLILFFLFYFYFSLLFFTYLFTFIFFPFCF